MPDREPPDPRDYTPKHLADKILQSKSALEGERKQVTVLFADVKGSMELAEGIDPEEWHRILDRFFQILADGVHRFEGTVNQYTGDGIMALFGAPIAHEDHAQRACYAALHLRDELRGYGDELRRRGVNFSVRMGLNSGEVVVGKIGDDLRMDYTAQGQTVGLAQRVEQTAAADTTYVTKHTADLVQGFFQLRDLGPFELKGVREPLYVFELEGIGALRTRFDVSRARGFSRFVGREAEMEILEQALARSLEGAGQVVGIVGEAGIGKSRLCFEFVGFEFVGRCRARGIGVTEGTGLSHGKMIPLLPVLAFFRAAFGITDRDANQAAREKIAGRVLLLEPELAEELPLVFDFLGVPDPEKPAPRMDPEALQKRLQEFTLRFMRARSRREPTVLLFDDLHWLDGPSRSWLPSLVQAACETRTLFIGNYRPEFEPPWRDLPSAREIALTPLGQEATQALLEDLLGGDGSLAALKERIRERTAGNPFFTLSLAESGQIEGVRGAYRASRPVEQIGIPETVQAGLAARIDQLGDGEKQLLQTAAVIGRRFPRAVLEAVVGRWSDDLDESIAKLMAREFVVTEALYPDVVYAFKHPLTQEVAYGSQLSERRALIHHAVAEAIAELHGEPLDSQAALLGHHREAAGEILEAARCHARAAGWVAHSDWETSRSHWQEVRRLLARQDDSPEKLGLDLMACGQLTMLGYTLGAPPDEIEVLFAEGKNLAERIGDPGSRSLLQTGYANYVGVSGGDIPRYVSEAREARRLAEASGDRSYRLAAGTALAMALTREGNPTESLELLEQCVADRPEDALAGREIVGASPWIFAVMHRFWPLGLLGRLGEADEALRQGSELAREHGELELLGLGLSHRVLHGEWSGEAATTLASVRQGVESAERTGVPFLLSSALASFGDALRLEQRYTEALEAYEKTLDLIRTKRVGLMFEPLIVSGQALVDSALGEHEKAMAQARSALEESVRRGDRFGEGRARLTLARVLLAAGDPGLHDEVGETVERAEALCEETGMRVYLPPLLEVRAALAERRGNSQEADEKLREAHRLYTEMGATGHAKRLAAG